MTISLAMDLLLAVLLVAMIFHGAMLNRRLTRLRDDREALAAVVRDFHAATGQATAGLDGMRTAADVTGKALQQRIDAARATIRDLEFLVERGERTADRLEGASRAPSMRSVGMPAAAPAAPLAAMSASGGAQDSRALLKAIEGMR